MASRERWAAAAIAATALLVGLALRWAALPYETDDVGKFLLPWYEHARRHGLASLGVAFTNYTPAFTYLLLAATAFDGLASPLTLVKAISFLFEAAMAAVAAALVRAIDPRPLRPALAFAAVFLAPSVLHNGAFWGQADAIWTLAILLCLLALLRDRPMAAVACFALAVSVKAQAVFLGPLLFGLLLRRAIRPVAFLLVPVVYGVLALPTLLAGRPAWEVATVYLDQAGAFRLLSVSAANLYVFFPDSFYGPGLAVGVAGAASAGLALAFAVARPERMSRETLLVAAAASLLLMPFVLPKMHERYFYAFEVLVLALAVARPAFRPAAALAQVTSLLAYLPFDGRGDLGVPVAAATNGAVLLFLLLHLHALLRGRAPDGPDALVSAVVALWLAFAAQLALLLAASRLTGGAVAWPPHRTDVPALVLFAASFALVVLSRDALAARTGLPARAGPDRGAPAQAPAPG